MSQALTFKDLFVHDSPAVASEVLCVYSTDIFIESIPL